MIFLGEKIYFFYKKTNLSYVLIFSRHLMSFYRLFLFIFVKTIMLAK